MSNSKRKRGPPPRPQGYPTKLAIVLVQHSREIKYHTREFLPMGYIMDLKNHPLLQFEPDTAEYKKFDALVDTEMLENRTVNWVWLDSVGQRDRIEALLGNKFRAAIDCYWPQYEELTLEFHSTFKHKEGTFAEPDAVSFSLGRVLHEMSIADFAVASGFYTREEVETPDFVNSLRGAYKKQRDCSLTDTDLAKFWATIADTPFSNSMLESDIRDPVLRYIHKILACTLIGRKSGENKVNWLDLFCLLCMVEQREANLACVLAWSFTRVRRGGPRAALDMGPYITRLAQNLRVFDRYMDEHLRPGPNTSYLGVKELQQAGIFTMTEPPVWEAVKAGPQVQPPEGSAAAEALHAGIPTRMQRPRHRSELPGRQYDRREPSPVPLTLEALWERIAVGQRRQDDAIRFLITSLGFAVPDFFRADESEWSG